MGGDMGWRNMVLAMTLVVIGTGSDAFATTLRLGYIEFPPYTYTSDKGVPSGILIDLAKKVYPEAGCDFVATSLPVRRLASYIGSGDLDIWMGLKTLPEFEGKSYIGKSVIAELVLRAYTRGKKPPILKPEDLSGKSIIVMRGYSYGGWINFIEDPKNKVDHIKANKHDAAFNMLLAGRAAYLLDYKEPSEQALQKIRIPDLAYNQISAFPCYFVVSKKLPDGQEIVNRLDKAYEKLKKKGVVP